MLKAYRNLDLRPAGVDSIGRLTTSDIDNMLMILNTMPQLKNINSENLDYAIAMSNGAKYYRIIITVRNSELPSPNPNKSMDDVVGFILGHVASRKDRERFKSFRSVKSTSSIFPSLQRLITSARYVSVVDCIVNMSQYSDASMTAFLLRKLQASWYGHTVTMLLHPGYHIDLKVGGQMVKFGFHLYGAGKYDGLSAPGAPAGKCAALLAVKVKDSREVK